MNGTPPPGLSGNKKPYTIKEVMAEDFSLPSIAPSNIVPKDMGGMARKLLREGLVRRQDDRNSNSIVFLREIRRR